MDVSADTGKVYVYAPTGDWIDTDLTLRDIHQAVYANQPKHDYLLESEREELYEMTNLLLFLSMRYNEHLSQKGFKPSGPAPTGGVKPPRF